MYQGFKFLYGKLYGESDAVIIFFNFNRLATGIWDLKFQSQGGDPKKKSSKNMDLLYSK